KYSNAAISSCALATLPGATGHAPSRHGRSCLSMASPARWLHRAQHASPKIMAPTTQITPGPTLGTPPEGAVTFGRDTAGKFGGLTWTCGHWWGNSLAHCSPEIAGQFLA